MNATLGWWCLISECESFGTIYINSPQTYKIGSTQHSIERLATVLCQLDNSCVRALHEFQPTSNTLLSPPPQAFGWPSWRHGSQRVCGGDQVYAACCLYLPSTLDLKKSTEESYLFPSGWNLWDTNIPQANVNSCESGMCPKDILMCNMAHHEQFSTLILHHNLLQGAIAVIKLQWNIEHPIIMCQAFNMLKYQQIISFLDWQTYMKGLTSAATLKYVGVS